MTDLNKLISSEAQDFFQTYKRLKIVIERGEGCYLYTPEGRKILDMFAGLAVNILGYNNKALIEAIDSQIKKYIHLSNYFYQQPQIKLAEKILFLSGFKKIFFTNSGTESIETAIKLIRKFFKGTEKKTLISFSGSFHGRTMGALSLTARKKYREDFSPFLSDTIQLTYNSIDELKQNINEKTAAVFIEPIQGEGGVNIARKDFIIEITVLQKKFGFLLVSDEIQSGVGRTGKLHGFEHFNLKPDIVTLAKGIGGGLPLGAVLGNEKVADVFSYGDHGSTFGGNPVACAAGIVIFDLLEKGLILKASAAGEYLKVKLNSLKQNYPEIIKKVRGFGLMIGIELNTPPLKSMSPNESIGEPKQGDSFDAQPIADKMLENNVLVNCTNGNVLRLLPPLIITENEIDEFAQVFEKVLKETQIGMSVLPNQ